MQGMGDAPHSHYAGDGGYRCRGDAPHNHHAGNGGCPAQPSCRGWGHAMMLHCKAAATCRPRHPHLPPTGRPSLPPAGLSVSLSSLDAYAPPPSASSLTGCPAQPSCGEQGKPRTTIMQGMGDTGAGEGGYRCTTFLALPATAALALPSYPRSAASVGQCSETTGAAATRGRRGISSSLTDAW